MTTGWNPIPFLLPLVPVLGIMIFMTIRYHLKRHRLSEKNAREVKYYKDLLDDISEIASSVLFDYDAMEQRIYWGKLIGQLLGMKIDPPDLTYASFIDFILESDRQMFRDEIRDSIRDQREGLARVQLRTVNGRIVFIEVRLNHYFDLEGTHKRTIGIIQDISDQIVSEKKLAYLLETSLDGLHIVDANGRLVNCSQSFADNLGYAIDELYETRITDWDKSIKEEDFEKFLDRLNDEPELFETTHLRKDGSQLHVQVNAKGMEINGRKYLIAWQKDITTFIEKEQLLEERQTELEEVNQELEAGMEELQKAKSLYQAERSKYKTILELASDGIFFMDMDGNLKEYSNKSKELLMYSDEEMEQLNVTDWDKDITPEIWESLVEQLKEGSISIERVHTRKDGTTYPCHITAGLIELNGINYIYSSVRDITESNKLLDELKDSNLRWQFALEGNNDGLWDWNLEEGTIYYSPQCRRMLGFEEHEVENTFEAWRGLVVKEDLKSITDRVQAYLEGRSKAYVAEYRVRNRQDQEVWIRDRGAIVERTPEGTPKRMIGTLSDISDYRNALETIRQQTYIDELTQLQNRKSYNERMDEELAQWQRYGVPFGLLLLDIDHFKSINDTYGHSRGDDVLRDLSRVISSDLRKNDYVYRIGGEEFAVIATGSTVEESVVLAEKLRTRVSEEVKTIKDHLITISLGVTQVMEEDTPDTIFIRADERLYRAKETGRNKVVS